MPKAHCSPQPKRHHTIPEMLQKRFLDSDERIWFYDERRPHEGVQRTVRDNLFVEKHIYSTIEEDGSRNAEQELIFAKLEGRADPLLDKIVESARRSRNADLTEEERALVNDFLMFQMKRVPDFFKKVAVDAEGQIETYIAEFEADGGIISEVEKAFFRDPAFVKRAVQNARVFGVGRQSDRILSAFATKGLTVAHVSPDEGSFILGSHPTARYAAPDGRNDLSHPEVELWLPVASDVAITLYGDTGTERLVKLNNAVVSKINRTIYDQSTVVASGVPGILEALIGS